jgi:muramoyltetrapeptide carboxypeptidase LdcA involved in peptidoglycan recycling
VKGSHPPFVLTRENAIGFFNPSSLIKRHNKAKLIDKIFKQRGLRKTFKEFLKAESRERFLS